MARCPHCRARLGEGCLCRRCGADLGRVLALEARAKTLAGQALDALLAGDPAAASSRAAGAAVLHATPFYRTLAAFLASRNPET